MGPVRAGRGHIDRRVDDVQGFWVDRCAGGRFYAGFGIRVPKFYSASPEGKVIG